VTILFLTPRFPYPTNKGDKLRSYHEIVQLAALGHRIMLVAAADEPLAPGALDEMRRHCARVEVVTLGGKLRLLGVALRAALSPLPAQVAFYQSRALGERFARVLADERPDIVHATLARVLPYVWNIPGPPVVVDLMDAFERSLDDRKSTAPWWQRPFYAREARRIAAYERAACAHFPRLAVSAEPDRAALGAPNVSVVRSAADLTQFAYHPEGREPATLVLTGNMGYQPNVDAALWFSKEIWPRIRAARPEARWLIVGARPAASVSALASLPGVEVTGPVERVSDYLQRATISVCPVRVGSGVQTKVMEAFASGTPAVVTSRGNEGIGGTHERELLIADEAPAFAAAVLRLLDDAPLRARLARDARTFAEREFDWRVHAQRLEALYLEAIGAV